MNSNLLFFVGFSCVFFVLAFLKGSLLSQYGYLPGAIIFLSFLYAICYYGNTYLNSLTISQKSSFKKNLNKIIFLLLLCILFQIILLIPLSYTDKYIALKKSLESMDYISYFIFGLIAVYSILIRKINYDKKILLQEENEVSSTTRISSFINSEVILYFFLVMIFLYKIILAWEIGNPYHDEGVHVLQLTSLVNGNILPILDSGRLELRGLLFNYLSYFLSLTGIQELYALRLVSILFSTLCLYIIYLIGKSLFNSRVGLITILIFSTNSIFIAYSLLGRFYTESFFWTLLFLYVFFILNSRNVLLKIVLSFFGFISFFFNITLLGVLFIKEIYEKRYKDGFITLLISLSLVLFWIFIINSVAEVEGTIFTETSSSLNFGLTITKNQSLFYLSHFKMYGSYGILLMLIGIYTAFYSKNRSNNFIYFYIIVTILGILFLALFVTNWYSLRYILNAYFLIIMILLLSGFNFFIRNYSKANISLLVIISILGFNIYSSFNGKELYYNNGYFLTNYIGKSIEVNQSILLSSSVVDNSLLVQEMRDRCSDKKCIVFSSDIYNTHVLFDKEDNIDSYIINQYLYNKGGYAYINDDGLPYCLYSNIRYLTSVDDIRKIEERNKGKQIFFLTRHWRFYEQNKGEIADYISKNYELISQTKEVYRGNYGSQSYDKYMLFYESNFGNK